MGLKVAVEHDAGIATLPDVRPEKPTNYEVGLRTTWLQQLGIRFPDTLAVSLQGAGTAGQVTLREWHERRSDLVRLTFTDPLFLFSLKQQDGLASVLADLGLPRASLVRALLAFNVGVEIGQLAIVAVALALAYAFRRTWAYERLGLVAGSFAIAIVSIGWFVQRAFQVSITFF